MALRPGDEGETETREPTSCVLSPPLSLPFFVRLATAEGETIVLKPGDVAPDFTLHTWTANPFP